ncbi:N-formylglutamate deformylase [Caenimonas sedimenti]|uniref:N-formylglutamate deformylase n=1 Tax=Caenimonas sedimenti TaxID=2596921 RepID=A0A562ZWX0_9BURK|nr:N-formylglutamate deformylase [Caenimonas sedimenti]TWO72785.1 N-formylglutamate deformylase [Caenimonas sedimenti]
MTFDLHTGTAPLLVSMPHIGTEILPELVGGYVPRAIDVEDTDWHLARLYDFLDEFGASVLTPRLSRYVIDLNRPPDDAPMYPGASNTELCPTRFFTGEPLHVEGGAPDAAERQRRREQHWQPYHDALAAELARLKSLHGFAVLWDAHSIRSQIPWLFEGLLPDLNIGTAGGASAHPSIAAAVTAAAARAPGATHVLNGRFQGGYITRHYGRPAEHVHAVQLEMTQKLYMAETFPFVYDELKAAAIRPTLRSMVGAALEAAQRLHGG